MLNLRQRVEPLTWLKMQRLGMIGLPRDQLRGLPRRHQQPGVLLSQSPLGLMGKLAMEGETGGTSPNVALRCFLGSVPVQSAIRRLRCVSGGAPCT